MTDYKLVNIVDSKLEDISSEITMPVVSGAKDIVISTQGRQGAFFCPHENGTEYVLFSSSVAVPRAPARGMRPRAKIVPYEVSFVRAEGQTLAPIERIILFVPAKSNMRG